MRKPALALLLIAAACSNERSHAPILSPPVPSLKPECGVASYYHRALAGNPTANGEVYDPNAMTAAHKTLPFDTVVRVRRWDDGRTVRVRINDRGPFIDGRVIDLAPAAARKIGLLGEDGVAEVCLKFMPGG